MILFMKNKGRQHISHLNGNCKSLIMGLTRPIRSMSHRDHFDKFDKHKWQKRIRGYFKSQTKEIL